MGGAISRREFLSAAAFGTGFALAKKSPAEIFLGAEPAYDSIDSLVGTDKMIETFTNAKLDTMKDWTFEHDDNTTFMIETNIGDYELEYYGQGFSKKGKLHVTGGGGKWTFYTNGSQVTGFEGGWFGDLKFDPELLKTVWPRVHDLLDVEVIRQDSKGKNLTSYMDTLAKRLLSLKEFPLQYQEGYGLGGILEVDDLWIHYHSKDLSHRNVELSINQGDHRFSIEVQDKESNGKVCVHLNGQQFSTQNGGVLYFQSNIYNKSSAEGIFQKALTIQEHFTLMAANKRLTNYADRFLELLSQRIDTVTVSKTKEGYLKLQTKDADIEYESPGKFDIPIETVRIKTEEDTYVLNIDPNTKKLKSVKLNGHPFILTENGTDYIRGTYSNGDAYRVIRASLSFYERVRKMESNKDFLSRDVGQPLVRHA